MDHSFASDEESVPLGNTGNPLGAVTVHFARKFQIRREWLIRFPHGRHILAEYNYGQFFRAYKPTSTVHQSGNQVITSLLFFTSYDAMTHYIDQQNLPTELYHTYSATQLSTNQYSITDYKIRYNRAEQTGYFTLPLQKGFIRDTSLRIGNTVNISLFDKKTKTKQNVTLHKILAKEYNYCAIRLTPTATKYFLSTYQIDEFPLLATRHITMTIEKTVHQPVISQLRFRHVNLAKPSLLEEIFKTPAFFKLFIQKFNLGKVVEANIHFGPDGRQRPDIILKTHFQESTLAQVIGECKAVCQRYAQRALENALVQLLFYKTKNTYKTAQKGLLIVTGKPLCPSWTQIKQIIHNYAQRNPKVKLYRYSRQVLSHLKQHHLFREWCQNNLILITGQEIKNIIQRIPDRELVKQLESMLNFIEK